MEKKNTVKILENKKVLIKAFEKDRPFFPAGHDGRIRYTGCTVGYKLPWETSAGRFVKIFEPEEQAVFEDKLGLEVGALNLYKRKGSWLSQHNVELTKDDTELDLNSPLQALELRILKANKDYVCASKDLYNGVQDFYIVDENVSAEENYTLSEKKIEAMELFMKIRKSDKKMYDLLRVLGKNPTKAMSSNTKALTSELTGITSQIPKIAGQPNIDDFLFTAKDALFQDKVFVLDAIEIGEIAVTEGSYKMKETGQPLGRSLNETAEYFNSPKHQDDKLLVQQRIELNKGN